ncbi:hypothetical protein MKX07_008865 [Trichoderma sp. CBMAI-0711]|nr:hypothetical protein MKX07_008865 [Trichoderma sp. CBMAI-0711]
MLGKTEGAIFIGVPSEGMNIEDIHSMLGDQPNTDTLVAEISRRSDFLSGLEEHFSGISRIRGMKLFWAYETQTTPTVELIRLLADRLRDIVCNSRQGLVQESHDVVAHNPTSASPTLPTIENNSIDTVDPSEDLSLWDPDAILLSIRAPERDERLEKIDRSAGCSFEWAFENNAIGLTSWLQKGEGLFWVSGRPASGKSTFMKFLHEDKRTSELLRGWYSKAQHVEANFFFHYRGLHIQKSFEGLLRGILSQILEQAPAVCSLIHSIFQQRYRQLINSQSLGSLHSDLRQFFVNNGCETPERLFLQMVAKPLLVQYGIHIKWKEVEQWTNSARVQLPASVKGGTIVDAVARMHSEWSDEARGRLFPLVCAWLEAIDLKENLLRLKGLSSMDSINTTAQTSTRKIIREVETITKRHRSRVYARQYAQNRTWTLHELEQALFQIIEQQSIDLDLCIFIDALDEYDGTPEFIAEFLNDITRNRNSRTRVKVLFSSRPWDKLTDAFKDCPGFRIHEHTENDIRELCLHVIQTECPGSRELLQLVEDIGKLARGVFLWVKLVLYDLSEIVAASLQRGDVGTLYSELQEALQNLPRDLVEYYSGLVEVVETRQKSRMRSRLQLLHQTTVDFVQLPGFKNLVLGPGAHAMLDNGYTFLAKLELLRPTGAARGAFPIHRLLEQDESLRMVSLLAAHGFPFETQAECLSKALFWMRSDWERLRPMEPLVLHVTRQFTNPNIALRLPQGFYKTLEGETVEIPDGTANIIHLAPYDITKDLLVRTADPNSKESRGYTPLDCHTLKLFNARHYRAEELYRLMALIVHNGGRLEVCSRVLWEKRMLEFQEAGLDVSLFERLGYPKWINKDVIGPTQRLRNRIVRLLRR